MVINAKEGRQAGRQAGIITEIIHFWVGTFLEHGTLNHPKVPPNCVLPEIFFFSGCPFPPIQDGCDQTHFGAAQESA
jgi:hypothetical protein